MWADVRHVLAVYICLFLCIVVAARFSRLLLTAKKNKTVRIKCTVVTTIVEKENKASSQAIYVHRAVMFSNSITFSQTPAYTARL